MRGGSSLWKDSDTFPPGTGGDPDEMRDPSGHRYDFSREHILKSVDGSLKRLNTEYVDLLLLHRPDALMEPEEVAEAFDTLKTQGKVRAFGVSNHNPMQIELLNQATKGAVRGQPDPVFRSTLPHH